VALEHHNRGVLDRHLREFEPDVVSWWALGGMSLSLIERVRWRGIPAVGVVVDDWMIYGPKVDAWNRAARRLGVFGRLAGALAGIPARVRLGEAADWVFVSETVRRRAREAGWELPRTSVAHAGIESDRFRPAREREWSWRLLYLGRIDPRKGITTAVRALAGLPAEATLRVVGGGDEEHLSALRVLIADLGLTERVIFDRVQRDSVPDAYADADAVLFPVLWEEPFGLVPLEAMAVGRPVIATGAGGSGEYLVDGQNCLVFEPRDDPSALADSVRRLAGDAALRARLRAGGLATAQRFDERHFNEAVERALSDAVAARPRPAGR
jgi:glycosyltransferase involved in cell wall biosynthesis